METDAMTHEKKLKRKKVFLKKETRYHQQVDEKAEKRYFVRINKENI